MAGTHSTDEATPRRRERRRWVTGQLIAFCLACTVVTVVAGVVQVSNGVYEMTVGEAWAAVFNPNVVLDPRVWGAFLLGGDLPEMGRNSLVVWNLRIPRVLVGIVAGATLAVSGAIFQAITRNELASPFVLGVSSGAGFAVLASLVLFEGLRPFLPLIASPGSGRSSQTVRAGIIVRKATRSGTAGGRSPVPA